MFRKALVALVIASVCGATPAFAAYGVIAYSPATGNFWGCYNEQYLGDAEVDALLNCKAPEDARVVAWSAGGWCALAIDDAGNWGAANAPTQDAANAAALAYCTGANPRLLDSIFAGN